MTIMVKIYYCFFLKKNLGIKKFKKFNKIKDYLNNIKSF